MTWAFAIAVSVFLALYVNATPGTWVSAISAGLMWVAVVCWLASYCAPRRRR